MQIDVPLQCCKQSQACSWSKTAELVTKILLKGGLTNLVGRLLKDKALCVVRGSDNGASSKILVGLRMPIIIRVVGCCCLGALFF
jgi:hypothetical protein